MLSEKERITLIKEALTLLPNIPIHLMEVCGTHTMSIARFGLKSLLPSNIHIISGPGCPVCVTAARDINTSIELAKKKDTIVTSFGDLLKVPCKDDCLANYQNVKVIYNPLDAITFAEDNPSKEVILLGIGFETTTPLIAATAQKAIEKNIQNFSILSMHKLVPPAMEIILKDKMNSIAGFILPGHVSAITGKTYFNFITSFNKAGVISGFEPLDIMESIYLLAKLITQQKAELINNYARVVRDEGNRQAMTIMEAVFQIADSTWRGIGRIPKSGLELRKEYETLDARKRFDIPSNDIQEAPGCLCGAILMGRANPKDCSLMGTTCTPSSPMGPCMVSSEGTCAAFYKYGQNV